jgi:hypothetical protein
MRVLSKAGVIAAAPLLILSFSFVAHAQGDAIPSRTPASGYGPISQPSRPNTKVIYKDRVVRVTPTTGALTIVAEPGASIRLEYLRQNGEVLDESESSIGTGERSIILNDLRPGRYRVFAELNGYRLTTGPREVTVNKGKAERVELTLEPITYNVTVRLNAASGKLYYAKPGEVERSVDIQNSQANLSNLTGGNYTIKIRPDDDSYKPLNETLSISSNREVSFKLEKLAESKEFSPASASDWALPGGWQFFSGKLRINGNGIAVPSDSNYRNYKDFHLSTVVTMLNGVAASFVVHEIDPQNYYLVQITGPNADEPYVLRGYIVRNGSPQRFGRTTPISQFSKTLNSSKGFQVVLTMEGSTIKVKVLDTETGDLLELGTLPDPSNAFPIGAVGVAARSNEQNEVGMFIICSAENMRAHKCID